MGDQELYSGLIRLHVLYHASQQPVYGFWLMNELSRHGYRIGPGTLYPLLHRMERRGYLLRRGAAGGRGRRTYVITRAGRKALAAAKVKVRELYEELFEDEAGGKDGHEHVREHGREHVRERPRVLPYAAAPLRYRISIR